MCLDLAGIQSGNQALRIPLLDTNQIPRQILLNRMARNQKALMSKMAGDDLRGD
jgi:hypothetical protein